MPPEPPSDIEEFVVLGARVEALEASRAESDQMINTLSAEEFSKFAATDVGDAIKRIAGVNVVEGQFAIIRGLEDRYSSTLFNSAPIPSPDPNKPVRPARSVPLRNRERPRRREDVRARSAEQLVRRLDRHHHERPIPKSSRSA